MLKGFRKSRASAEDVLGLIGFDPAICRDSRRMADALKRVRRSDLHPAQADAVKLLEDRMAELFRQRAEAECRRRSEVSRLFASYSAGLTRLSDLAVQLSELAADEED